MQNAGVLNQEILINPELYHLDRLFLDNFLFLDNTEKIQEIFKLSFEYF